jgi:hypothetical protein
MISPFLAGYLLDACLTAPASTPAVHVNRHHFAGAKK